MLTAIDIKTLIRNFMRLAAHQQSPARGRNWLAALFVIGLVLYANTLQAQSSAGQWVPQDRLAELVDPSLIPANGSVEAVLTKADPRIEGTQCPAVLFANTKGNKMWGRTFVEVQCVGGDLAPFFVNVDIKVWAPVMVVKQTVQANQAITKDDVEMRSMDLTQLQHGWMTEYEHLANKTAVRQLWPGTLLRQDYLKGQSLVRNGDLVKVILKGAGFQIAATATAMEAAELGEVLKIKTSEGKILHGIAVESLLVEVAL